MEQIHPLPLSQNIRRAKFWTIFIEQLWAKVYMPMRMDWGCKNGKFVYVLLNNFISYVFMLISQTWYKWTS
jgi:hypothetical protein